MRGSDDVQFVGDNAILWGAPVNGPGFWPGTEAHTFLAHHSYALFPVPGWVAADGTPGGCTVHVRHCEEVIGGIASQYENEASPLTRTRTW